VLRLPFEKKGKVPIEADRNIFQLPKMTTLRVEMALPSMILFYLIERKTPSPLGKGM
jgi:hypothetical protein